MGFENGRVSPAETCLVLAETSLTRKENREDQNNSFDDSAVNSKENEFDSHDNPRRKSYTEPGAHRNTKSAFGRDPRAKRQLFDRLLILVTFVSFGSLILILSIAFGVLGSKCACSGPFEEQTTDQSGETSKRFMEMQQNMTGLHEKLEKSDIAMKNHWSKLTIDKKELTDKLRHLEAEAKSLTTSFGTWNRKVLQIEEKLKRSELCNSSTPTKDSFEFDAVALWYEVNNTKKGLAAQNKGLADAVQQFKRNLTHMRLGFADFGRKINVTIKRMDESKRTVSKKLELVNETLTTKVDTISSLKAPRGPPGFNGSQGLNGSPGPAGPPGPTGSGNFSQCQHKTITSAPVNTPGEQTEVVLEPDGKRIIGVTCSSDHAKEYKLTSKLETNGVHKGKWLYTCTCKGRSDVYGAATATCTILYWECPLVT